MTQEEQPNEGNHFTPKVQRFIERYVQCGNATRSAEDAGYSKKTAYSIGWENLRKPEIRAEIDRRLRESTLTPDETLKSITDIAKASLNDYLTVRTVANTPQLKKSLFDLIQELKNEIEDAEKFVLRAGIKDEEALEEHRAQQSNRKAKILKYEIELERNQDAYRIVNGPTEFVEVAELDLVRIAKDREAGRIKTFQVNENGTKIEMYPADAALRDLARIHGLFEKDNTQLKPVVTPVIQIIRPA